MEVMKTAEGELTKTQVNPWTWQDKRGFSQAWLLQGARSLIVVSGQVALDADGKPVGTEPVDFEAQARKVFENLRTVLEAGGASLNDIVKLNVFLTDMSKVGDYGRIKAEFMKGAQPASTAVGVTALAMPGLMIEVEALAAI
jgi:enamine deaminase RidA (YjgF/YER057c/UK114 family)